MGYENLRVLGDATAASDSYIQLWRTFCLDWVIIEHIVGLVLLGGLPMRFLEFRGYASRRSDESQGWVAQYFRDATPHSSDERVTSF